MSNPKGPYPGRQLFLGLTVDRRPCLAYLVTGRSPESRQRKAVQIENTVRIGPLGDIPYDPLRHYTAVKYDNSTGIAAVSNGIQTEVIYENCKLLFNVGTSAAKDFIEKLLNGANVFFIRGSKKFYPSRFSAESDSLHTPRIVGVVVPDKGKPVFIIGIKTHNAPATVSLIAPSAGRMTGISTYQGNLDNPEPTNPAAPLAELEFNGSTPHDLAKYLYDISAASYKGDDIRVCSVGGIYSAGSWDIAILNKN